MGFKMFNASKKIFAFILLGGTYTIASHAETYTATTAKNYAVTHYNTAYGTGSTQNPFPNVSEIGGNCTNFGNQVISSGLLLKTTPKSLNGALVTDKKFPSSIRSEWFFKCNNKVDNSCQSSAWRGAQSMFSFSRDLANAKALRMTLVTKNALVNGKITPLNHILVKVGDIIFADFDFSSGATTNSINHTMIVTETRPVSWYDITQNAKYNSIRLTYQSDNKTDQGLGDIQYKYSCSFCNTEPVFYVYRPTGYSR